jgi:hypothetical protein
MSRARARRLCWRKSSLRRAAGRMPGPVDHDIVVTAILNACSANIHLIAAKLWPARESHAKEEMTWNAVTF